MCGTVVALYNVAFDVVENQAEEEVTAVALVAAQPKAVTC